MLAGVLLIHLLTLLTPLASALCPSNAESDFYNVTSNPATIYSHSTYEGGSNYPATSTITCMFISTAPSGKVIKLKQEAFALEKSADCIDDYLILYDGDKVTHKKEDQMGTYCGTIGPDEAYSSTQYMTLYFYTDHGGSGRGFKFEASSIDKDDVPSPLGVAAIVLITTLCLAVTALIVVIVIYVIWKKKQKPEEEEEYEDDEETESNGQGGGSKPSTAKTKTTST